jgi:N-dimethylarginine dimethylaminohydrolase
MTYSSVSELDFQLNDLTSLPHPTKVVLASPEHFDVTYVINAHMEGNIGSVDTQRAQEEWSSVLDAYARCGMDVQIVSGIEGLPDMVFCANQTLPFISADGSVKGVVLSKMYAPQRAGEVEFFSRYFSSLGYLVIPDIAEGKTEFEGMGDALWHSGRRLLWGGYGFRTKRSVYEVISRELDVPILLLNLEDPDFYHLDTCMCILDERTVLVFPGAFTPEGMDLIRHFFPVVLEAPEDEARTLFACNAHCPDRKHVLIQQGCVQTNRMLAEHGFEVIELDSSEFLKSGGSIFCMKLMTW